MLNSLELGIRGINIVIFTIETVLAGHRAAEMREMKRELLNAITELMSRVLSSITPNGRRLWTDAHSGSRTSKCCCRTCARC